jgi:hypothetical protein
LVTVDGSIVYDKTKLFANGDVIQFQVGGEVAMLNIGTRVGGFTYQLTVANTVILDLMSRVAAVHTVKAKVVGHELRNEAVMGPVAADGGAVVMYRVEIRRGDAVEDVRQVWRRFRTIAALDAKVRAVYAGSHLLDNLPRLPSKEWKWYTDHLEIGFVLNREALLTTYMER